MSNSAFKHNFKTISFMFRMQNHLIICEIILAFVLKSDWKWKWQSYELDILGPFPVIFSPTTLIASMKLRIWRSFWCAQSIQILIGSKAMTQITIFVLFPFPQFCFYFPQFYSLLLTFVTHPHICFLFTHNHFQARDGGKLQKSNNSK